MYSPRFMSVMIEKKIVSLQKLPTFVNWMIVIAVWAMQKLLCLFSKRLSEVMQTGLYSKLSINLKSSVS